MKEKEKRGLRGPDDALREVEERIGGVDSRLVEEMSRVGVQITQSQAKKAVEHGWSSREERDFLNRVVKTCGDALGIIAPTTFDDTIGGGVNDGRINYTQIFAPDFRKAPHVIGFHELGHCIEYIKKRWPTEFFMIQEDYLGEYISEGFEHERHRFPPFSLTKYHQSHEGQMFNQGYEVMGKDGSRVRRSLRQDVGYGARQIYCDSIGFKEVLIRELSGENPVLDTNGQSLTIDTLIGQYLNYLEAEYDNITGGAKGLVGRLLINQIPVVARFAASASAMEYLAAEIPSQYQSDKRKRQVWDWSDRFLNLFGHSGLRSGEVIEIRDTPTTQLDESTRHLRHIYETGVGGVVPASGLTQKEIESIAILVRAYKRHFLACVSRRELMQEDDLRPHFERLRDGSETQRIKEIHLMQELGDIRALGSLLDILDNKGEGRDTIVGVCEAIGEIGNKNQNHERLGEAVQKLREVALKHKDVDVRRHAIGALGVTCCEQAKSVLSRLALKRRYDLREEATEALGDIGGDDIIPTLAKVIKKRRGGREVRAALKALGKVGGEEALGVLIPVLKDNSGFIREGAIKAVGEAGGEKAAQELVRLVQVGGHYRLGERNATNYSGRLDYWKSTFDSINALGEIGGEHAIKALSEMAVGNPDKNWRHQALSALGKTGDKRAVPTLVEISKNRGPYRSSAIEALTRIDNNLAVQFLMGILEAPDEDTIEKENAIRTLGGMRDARAVPLLVDALGNGKGQMRRFAAEALGRIGGEEAFKSLVKALEEQHMDEAAGALGDMGDANAIGPLTRALGDRNWRVRSSAARALGDLDANQSVPALINALDDEERNVRTSAAGALGKIGNPSALPHLWRLHNKSKNIPGINEMNCYGDAISEINIRQGSRTKV